MTGPKSDPPTQTSWPEGQWSTGLYDCWDDRSNCCQTFICPCITMGQIVEIVDRGTTSGKMGGLIYFAMERIGCGWLYASTYRRKLRTLFNLPEAPCADGLIHCCCCLCGITQEYRELVSRGVDPSIGWEGNVEKWKQEGVKNPPITLPAMSR